MKIFLTLSVLIVFVTPGHATTLSGSATVHDGDTIKIGRQSIRLWGIDAVELRQTCGDVKCGELARDMLKDIVANRNVTCTAKGRSYKRIVATCMVGDVDVAALMAARGMAYDATRYSKGFYKDAQDSARLQNIGLWAMNADDPAHWRACNLPFRKHNRPTDCAL